MVMMLGQFASQIAIQQRELRPTSTQLRVQTVGAWQNPKTMGSSQEHGITHKTKSFKDVMRECYWKREQARREQDRDAQELMLLRRIERNQLFGYVLTLGGQTLTIDEAMIQMRKGKLTKNEIVEWHSPEIYIDNVNSIGERDSLGEYPALDINRADVLRDPKLRDYIHPSLRAG